MTETLKSKIKISLLVL